MYTQCVDYRGRFVNSGAHILQWEDDSNKNSQWTPAYVEIQNATVAATIVSIDDFNFMKMQKNTICLRWSPEAHLRMAKSLQRVHFIP